MSRTTIRIWYLIHKWSSLIPTAFLLMLCVSGLPLIFHDEIDAAMGFDTEKSLSGVASSAADRYDRPSAGCGKR